MTAPRRWFLPLAGLALAAMLAYGFWPKPLEVDAAVVRRGPMQVVVEEEGRTRVRDRFVVSAPVAGQARRLPFKVGDAVAEGEVLFRLDATVVPVLDARSRATAEARVSRAQAALRAAQARLAAAQSEADLARTEYRRMQRLSSSGAVARDERDRAAAADRSREAERRSAGFDVKVAEFELEAARTELRYTGASGAVGPATETVSVRAPVRGRVLKLLHESAGVVAAAEPMLELGDPAALEVVIEMLSTDAVRVQPGMTVWLERWGGPKPLQAQVRRVEPVGFTKVSALGVEEQRVLVLADITSPPATWKRLGDGYRVECRVVLWSGTNVLQIPTSALFPYREGWAVFVVAGGRAQRRTVTLGRRSGLHSEVKTGLVVRDLVITHPDSGLEEGTRVTARNASANGRSTP